MAGGLSGSADVYDAETGGSLAEYQLATVVGQTFVNDVIVTRSAAYFTDSFRPCLYRVPLGPRGELHGVAEVEEIPLTGDLDLTPAPFVFKTNGSDALLSGGWLVVVDNAAGALYRVDPTIGYATEIDLGGEQVTAGDGILLDGLTLYVMRNRLNEIAVIELDRTLTSGEVVDTITAPNFRVPTTIAVLAMRSMPSTLTLAQLLRPKESMKWSGF